jgi:hypothetical protein
MAEAPKDHPPSCFAVLKVLYLLAVTALAFAAPAAAATRPARWYVVPGLLLVQVVTLLVCRVGPREVLRGVRRLQWLFVFLILCYTLLPPEGRAAGALVHPWRFPGTHWTVPLNLTGLAQAALMCLQILTVILASALVRLTGPGTDLIDGLRGLGLPRLFVHSFDQTLDLLGGPRRPGGGPSALGVADAPDARAPSPGLFAILRRLLRGDLGFFIQIIQGGLDRARAQVTRDAAGRLDPRLAHDVAVVSGVALVMVGLKMVKLLPGVPFAPGLKTLLLFPLYTLAAYQTRSRWGATAAGALMGVIGFLQGDGRYGVLEVLKHLAPGLVIDLSLPLVRRLPQTALVFCLLGGVAAIARTSTELAVVLLLGARAEVYLFPAARLVPNLIAGTLSGFVTAFVLRAFRPGGPAPPPGVPAEAAPDPAGKALADGGAARPPGPGAIESPPSRPTFAAGPPLRGPGDRAGAG